MAKTIYVLNTHKKKLHNANCKYVRESKKIQEWEGTPRDALAEGYTVCQECIFDNEYDIPGLSSLPGMQTETDVTSSNNAAAILFGDTSGDEYKPEQMEIQEAISEEIVESNRQNAVQHEYQDAVESDEGWETAEYDAGDENGEKKVETAIQEDERKGEQESGIEVLRCPKCKEPLLPQAKFCLNCGAKVKTTTRAAAEKKRETKKIDLERINKDGYYSSVLPSDQDEKYSSSVGEMIALGICAIAGIAGIVCAALYFI